jgi:hypothetical protein
VQAPDASRIKLFRFRRVELSGGRGEHGVLACPDGSDLRDFFLLRHAGEQIFDTLIDRCSRVLVDGCVPARLRITGSGQDKRGDQ